MAATESTKLETIRIHQANERTMLAWVRTGIALMAFGFAIARFGVFLRQVASVDKLPRDNPFEHAMGSAWVGASLVACGMIATLVATLRFKTSRNAIESGELGAPSATAVYVLGTALTLIGITMTVLLVRAIGP